MPMDEELSRRLALTYGAASKPRWPATVSIHVARDVLDALRDWLPRKGPVTDVRVESMWGYTLLCEDSFEPGRIEVRATEVIV